MRTRSQNKQSESHPITASATAVQEYDLDDPFQPSKPSSSSYSLKVVPSSSIRAQTSWASLTSQESSTDLDLDAGFDASASPASSFTSEEDTNTRHHHQCATARRFVSPPLSPTSTLASLSQLRRRASPPALLSLPKRSATTKPTLQATSPSSSKTKRKISRLRRLANWTLYSLILYAAYYVYVLVHLPSLPNLIATAQVLATHVEIARDVCRDVKLLSAAAGPNDFDEHEMVQLSRVVRPFSEQAAQGLEVTFKIILQIKHGLTVPTSKVATRISHFATQIDALVPMLQEVSDANALSSYDRDVLTEETISQEFDTFLQKRGIHRVTDLHDSLTHLLQLSQILSHLLQTEILPHLPASLGPFAQPLPVVHEGGLRGWWKRSEKMRMWEEGEFGREREAKRREEMVDRLIEFARFVEGWKLVIENTERRVANWLNAEGLWVRSERFPKPASKRRHDIFVEGYPHLSTRSSSAAPDSESEESLFIASSSVNVDAILEFLQPTLDELLDLTRRARLIVFDSKVDTRSAPRVGEDHIELTVADGDEIVEEIWKWQFA
ncbi:hypothetical protein FRB96_004021 [Tulasnella sp. 330]|nr:hypothetical protein FRB96_004021 [Tulasnella sp. 330]KAG8885998.1 hypothetical protein FRB97_008536 [Tulasnella sp. 331]KAG8888287.1 hypothetical protein FRB98_008033 [Tulasnella sp. 332]